MSPRQAQAGRGRGAARANGAVAVVTLTVLMATALVATPPSPPSIAEFSPQAQQQIQDAPEDQDAGEGAVAASERETVVIEEDEAAANVPERGTQVEYADGVPSAVACVTWPDGSVTQTFDPQSPPCVASWDGVPGEAGATAPGVTATDIRIAVGVPREGASDHLLPIIEHFNTSYQFYGRRLVLEEVVITSWGDNGARDPANQRASAEAIAEIEPFASLTHTGTNNTNRAVFTTTLAENKVIVLTGTDRPAFVSEAQFRSWEPYVVSFVPPLDVVLREMGKATCRQLVGKNARFSPQVAAQERKFAVLVPSTVVTAGVPVPGVDDLLDQLAACGLDDVPVVEYDDRAETADAGQTAIYTQLKLDGVTTVLYVLHGTFDTTRGGPLGQASRAAYQPEWFATVGKDDDTLLSLYTSEQAGHVFGFLADNKGLPAEERFESRALGGWQDCTCGGIYKPLLGLAAGIQAAGPNLSPETMAAALAELEFPNPGQGAAPYYQARVDLQSSPWMVDDYAMVWFDQSEQHWYAGTPGAWCYLEQGKRWTGDTWPTDELGLFDPASAC